ncbi:MAG: DUF3187 family protein [Gemmatimonadales bacterium]
MPRNGRRALVAAACLAAGPVPHLTGQSLPPYAPMNPVAYGRSGLQTAPYREPARGWRFTVLTDYASLIEIARLPATTFTLDAELLRLDVTVSRDIGKRIFVFGGTSLNGAYDGFLDGFLDWYHDLIGLGGEARAERPKNEFLYELELADGTRIVRPNPGEWIGDLRIGAGVRHTVHWQSTAWVTLPLSEEPDGFRRGVVSANLVTTLRARFATIFTYEGSIGVGWAGREGDLEDLQRTTFALVSSGLRARTIGPLNLYANLVYHSPYYRNAGLRSLDNRELTIDVGGIFRFASGPEWILGLTEDLEPRGPAVDLSFRIGARW